MMTKIRCRCHNFVVVNMMILVHFQHLLVNDDYYYCYYVTLHYFHCDLAVVDDNPRSFPHLQQDIVDAVC